MPKPSPAFAEPRSHARGATPFGRASGAPPKLERTFEAHLEASNAGAKRLILALERGNSDFVLMSRDGKVSATVRLTLRQVSASEYIVGGKAAVIDWSRKTVAVGRARVPLSQTELRLLAALIDCEGAVTAPGDLIARVWTEAERRSKGRKNALAVYVCTLRKRLALVGLGHALHTVRGEGYRLQR